ncbi:hypothetical protein FPCIR_1859 [Fusarium pseudocircinatum]|uniref:Uncharacterized protein n=1 Tax=Fusarium pseudocircinatum TaxID=56676 RepID=A0A8H5PTV4_9HYPO|nr:hypothetical protein FPCIR_1859 [Fusarium pseudocircinatum]
MTIHPSPRPHQYVSALRVVASDSKSFPPGACSDASPGMGSPDCNDGQDGDYTYVVKSFTSDPFQAITGLNIVITGSCDYPELGDIAKGAGGDYRYVVTSQNLNLPTRVGDVQLWRSQDDSVSLSDVASFGWDGISSDINHRRSGAYLYLVWKNVPA